MKISAIMAVLIASASSLLAQDAAAPAAGGGIFGGGKGGMGGFMLPMLALFVIWYFLLIRPQQKKEKNRKAMINALKKGDKIVTIGGISGVVDKIKDDIVTIKTAGSILDFTRSAISRVDTGKPAPVKK